MSVVAPGAQPRRTQARSFMVDPPDRESHQHVYIHLRWLPALQNIVGYRSPHRQAIGPGQNLHRLIDLASQLRRILAPTHQSSVDPF